MLDFFLLSFLPLVTLTEMPNQNFQNAGDLAGGAPEMQENRAEAKHLTAISEI